ncbi:mitochondrial matrix Mmp37-domain-containing protein [Haematococcus lacustris]
MAAPPLVSSRLHQILTHLPAASYAFAYGSGVLTQPGLYNARESQASTQSQAKPTADSQARGPQLDFILAVPDPSAWHAENIRANPSHYSWVAQLGPRAVTGIAQHIGVGIHFNTLVNINGQLVKYGVVGCNCLEDDLLTWRYLYVAGRLHKPVVHLVGRSQALAMAQAANLRAAAATALLLLPPSFTTQDLLVKLVGLSYHGDVRMGLAEDPHKALTLQLRHQPGAALKALTTLMLLAHPCLAHPLPQATLSSQQQPIPS